ncbi:MAG: hypothetical protein WBB01_26620 [Phormidesmis sp.]
MKQLAQTDAAALAETYLGNVSEDEDLARRLAQAKERGCCLEVLIERGDRIKGRLLTHTVSGQPVGIVKGRDWLLRDGDVLETTQNYLVLVSIQQQQVMTLRFADDTSNQAISLIHLGHVLGNRHWPITIKGETLFVELVAGTELMTSTIREMAHRLGITGLQINLEGRSAEAALDFSDAHHHHHH